MVICLLSSIWSQLSQLCKLEGIRNTISKKYSNIGAMIRNGCVGNFTLILLALIANHSVLCFVFRKPCNTLGKVTTAQHLASDPDEYLGLVSVSGFSRVSFSVPVSIWAYYESRSRSRSRFEHIGILCAF